MRDIDWLLHFQVVSFSTMNCNNECKASKKANPIVAKKTVLNNEACNVNVKVSAK